MGVGGGFFFPQLGSTLRKTQCVPVTDPLLSEGSGDWVDLVSSEVTETETQTETDNGWKLRLGVMLYFGHFNLKVLLYGTRCELLHFRV